LVQTFFGIVADVLLRIWDNYQQKQYYTYKYKKAFQIKGRLQFFKLILLQFRL
jgi:hypothetical protein